MGSSHAISGAAVWVAVTTTATTLPSLGLHPLPATGVLLGAVVCAGAALLPDADHPDATIAHSLPGVGSAAAGAIGGLTGGHRHGMHSLLAVAGMFVAMLFLPLAQWTPAGWEHPIPVGAAVAVMACVAFAVKVLHLVGSWLIAWLIGAAAAAAMAWWVPGEFSWVPIAIVTGYAVHLAGDLLTVQGVPLLWPVNPSPPSLLSRTPIINKIWMDNGYVALPILGETGSWREWILGATLTVYVIWGVSATLGVDLPAFVVSAWSTVAGVLGW